MKASMGVAGTHLSAGSAWSSATAWSSAAALSVGTIAARPRPKAERRAVLCGGSLALTRIVSTPRAAAVSGCFSLMSGIASLERDGARTMPLVSEACRGSAALLLLIAAAIVTQCISSTASISGALRHRGVSGRRLRGVGRCPRDYDDDGGWQTRLGFALKQLNRC